MQTRDLSAATEKRWSSRAWISIGALAFVLSGCSALASTDIEKRPVTVDDAEAWLASAIDWVAENGTEGFCIQYAASAQSCEMKLSSTWLSAAPDALPVIDCATVVPKSEGMSEGVILSLSWENGLDSEVLVIRDPESGETHGINATYWHPMTFHWPTERDNKSVTTVFAQSESPSGGGRPLARC